MLDFFEIQEEYGNTRIRIHELEKLRKTVTQNNERLNDELACCYERQWELLEMESLCRMARGMM